MSTDKILSEARARIIWGDRYSAVRDFLISNNVPSALAEAKLKEFELERSRELRRIGRRNILIGSTLAVAAAVALYLEFPHATASSGVIRTLAVVLLAGLYGMWRLVKGIVYLVRPQAEHRSIRDIEQSDLIE